MRQMTGAPTLSGDCWPTPAQTHLLRAAFLSGAPAQQAWLAWRGWLTCGPHQGRLDQLDAGSRRLLPLLYRNVRRSLAPEQLADPLLAQFKDSYRKTWFRNQATFYQIAGLLEALHAAGLPSMVLKGAALAVLHYRDLGLRPMADFDIAVPAPQAVPAFQALLRLGWQSSLPVDRPGDFAAVKQSVDFRSPAGVHFDLHWHVLWETCYPGADDDFWAGALPLRINQVPSLALNPTDQLLHVCVHGASLNQVPPVRWAADAMQILRTPGAALDWPRLLAHAERLRLSLPLRDTLDWLRSALEAPVPAQVVTALAQVPVTAADREFYRRKISRRGLLGEIPLMWCHYRLLAQARQRPATRAGFIEYLRLNWGLVRGRSIPAFVMNKTFRRVKAVSRRPGLAEADLEPDAR
jgi:hypothetical protein